LLKSGKSGKFDRTKEYELSGETGENLARCVHSGPSQYPCISEGKDVPFLQVRGRHLSHEGFYDLNQGRRGRSESFQQLSFPKFLQLKIFNMPVCSILGQCALNPVTCNLTKHVTLGKISPGIVAIKSSVIIPQTVKQEYFPGV